MTEDRYKLLEHEDTHSNAVVSFDNGTTFKIGKLMEKLNILLKNLILGTIPAKIQETGLGTPPAYGNNWSNGVKAEILEPNTGKWKTGKVRLRVVLEFCPDEPEEKTKRLTSELSLDDIRNNAQ